MIEFQFESSQPLRLQLPASIPGEVIEVMVGDLSLWVSSTCEGDLDGVVGT